MNTILLHASKHKPMIATMISVIIGVGIGFILRNYTKTPWTERDLMYLKFPGEIFLRIVNFLILPLITSSIISATCNLSKAGPIGLMALYYYLVTTTLGITLSVILAETIRPGEWLKNSNKTSEAMPTNLAIDTILDLLRNLFADNIIKSCMSQYQTVLVQPKNFSEVPSEEWSMISEDIPGTNVLGIVFFSLLLGVCLGKLEEKGKATADVFHCLSNVMMKIMKWVTMAAPLGVLFLMPGRILEVDDFEIMLQRLGAYILTVFIGLIIQGYILLPLVYFIATGQSPYKIILKIGPAMATACGTSSSTATVPVTIKCLERLGINPRISKFIVPIGATINMDGIALYETIGAIFIIQLRGLQFSLLRIIVISIACTVSCIGAAGLPSGGYMMLIMVLNSVGVPAEDVSLIIAIDCFVDRFRTTINIIADALGAGIISHFNKNIKDVWEEDSNPDFS